MSDGPISSYSDPIYDRLDVFAQHLKRQWPIYLIAVLLIMVVVVVIYRARLSRPDAAAAVALSHALEESDPAKRAAALAEVGRDGSSPAYRAMAMKVLTEARLEAKDIPGARTAANDMITAADAGEDANLQLTARLSLAAVQMQAGEFAQAEDTYKKVVSRAGSTERLKAEGMTALIGAAQAASKQGPEGVERAITTLSPLLIRTVATGSEALHTTAKVFYWRLKRQQAEGNGPTTSAVPAAIPAPAPAATVAPAAGVQPVPVPATPPAPVVISPAPAPAATPADHTGGKPAQR